MIARGLMMFAMAAMVLLGWEANAEQSISVYSDAGRTQIAKRSEREWEPRRDPVDCNEPCTCGTDPSKFRGTSSIDCGASVCSLQGERHECRRGGNPRCPSGHLVNTRDRC
jgi:hypothetical protein